MRPRDRELALVLWHEARHAHDRAAKAALHDLLTEAAVPACLFELEERTCEHRWSWGGRTFKVFGRTEYHARGLTAARDWAGVPPDHKLVAAPADLPCWRGGWGVLRRAVLVTFQDGWVTSLGSGFDPDR